ncbi:MAG: response regulator [Planctomycetota bacterium]
MSPIDPGSLCLGEIRFRHDQACKGKKILIIDDETELLQTLGARLTHSGYSVQVADSGRKGIARAQEQKPDLIILDVIMPDMDGPQVAAALKSDPETSDIPILFLSCLLGNWSDGNGAPVFRDCTYMGKPYKPEELIEQVEVMMG